MLKVSGSTMEQTNREYATQFFGFPPEELSDELNSSTQGLLNNALEAMKVQLLKKQSSLEEEDVTRGFRKIEAKYGESVEKIFVKLAGYTVAHVFRIPSHVLLPEDEAWDGHTQVRAKAKLQAAEKTMERSRERIQNSIYKKAVLAAKLANMETVCGVQEQALSAESSLARDTSLEDTKDTVGATLITLRSLTSRTVELERLRQELGLPSRKREGCQGEAISRSKKQKLQDRVQEVQKLL